MFTMAEGLRGQAKPEERSPTKPVRLAALLGTLILTSVAVNAPIVLADSNAPASPWASGAASAIAEKADGSACHDRHAKLFAPHPFRGANAPAFNCSL